MKMTVIVLVLLAGLVVSGGVFLLVWDIPPPSRRRPRTLKRFSRTIDSRDDRRRDDGVRDD
jgi:hypothetical protein